jgi:pyridoxine kinase
LAILSFQSRVVYGHVGNSAAEFALRRLGVEVWPIDTVSFSNHPGYRAWRGKVRPAAEIAELVEGLAGIGVLPRCRAILSGYLGSEENGEAVLAAVDRVRAMRPDSLYCCDPVMGDRDTGLYVGDSLVRFFRDRAVRNADILTPNHFELEVLVGRPLPGLDDVVAAVDKLRAGRRQIALVSSLVTAGQPEGCIATLAASEAETWLATTPRLPLAAKGAGDLLAALFLARFLESGVVADALAQAVGSTFAVVERTVAEPVARELLLVAAQDALPAPPRICRPVRLR